MTSDYISREAADEACWKAVRRYPNSFCIPIEAARAAIRKLPAADVRPVVLCRDCVYAYPYGLEIKCTKHSGRADRFGEDATYSEFHSENWYCADAQKKREES